MKILITGAAGFIGYHLSKSLLNDGYEILGIDNLNDYYDEKLKNARLQKLKSYENFSAKLIDIANRQMLAEAFESFRPIKVVNLAAQPGVKYSFDDPYSYMRSNSNGFLNVIELCKNDVEGLIYASSSSVYGSRKNISSEINDLELKPLSLYGATKRFNEIVAHIYSDIYQLNTTGLRYFTVYGPWGRPDMAIPLFTNKIIKGEPIYVFNNGKMKRDFTYIDDIVNGTRSAIDNNYHCEIFNLGYSKSESLMNMISLIEKSLNMEARINFLPKPSGEPLETCSNIDYSIKKLGYKPKIKLNKGIPMFIDWYQKYYNA